MASYRVLKTTLIMPSAVTPALLDQCADLIREFACRYRPTVWGTLCQADARMWLEHAQTLRREALIAGVIDVGA
eukprot:4963868-Pyramimonas_sp.AAC.1